VDIVLASLVSANYLYITTDKGGQGSCAVDVAPGASDFRGYGYY
ncbi:MAG: hypothetical protein HW403_812, partial [Dehalococcoidia bacterium]|nr:hypothetical protein [Dehalococcoidia bacterium]